MKWRSLTESTPGTDSRPLAEILAERKAMTAKYVPAETQAVHSRVIAELRSQGIASQALAAGAAVPAFELRDHNGHPTSSAALLEQGKLVICFFRGRWCPFCVAQLEALNGALPRIEQAGALLVAISPQSVHQSYFMADQHQLRFPLLSDAGNQVARQFGLAYPVPEDQREIYRRAFVNLPFVNGDDRWILPLPAVYVVGRNHQVLYASVNPDYTERPGPTEILDRLLNPG